MTPATAHNLITFNVRPIFFRVAALAQHNRFGSDFMVLNISIALESENCDFWFVLGLFGGVFTFQRDFSLSNLAFHIQ